MKTYGIAVAVLALVFLLMPSFSLVIQEDSVGDVSVTSDIFNYVSRLFGGLFSDGLGITGMIVGDVSGESVSTSEDIKSGSVRTQQISINFPYTNSLDSDSDFTNIIWASEGNTVSRVTSGCWAGSCARLTPRTGQSYCGLGAFVLSDNPSVVHVRFLWKQDDDIYSTASSIGWGIQNKAVLVTRAGGSGSDRIMGIIDDDAGSYFAWTACAESLCYLDDGQGTWEHGGDESEFIKHPPMEDWYCVEIWGSLGNPTTIRTTKQDGTYIEWSSATSFDSTSYFNTVQIVGGFFNGATGSGHIHIDELKIDDGYIGPPAGFLGGDTPPTRTNPSPTGTLNAGTTSTNISLTTNIPAICLYSNVSGTNYTDMTDTFTYTNSTNHSTEVSELENGKPYIYYIRCNSIYGYVNVDDWNISFSIDGHKADLNDDGLIDMPELMLFIARWKLN
ncbi:MAG: hypothetical protein U9M95_01915, partial [Candidatus Altiarchaeota archaeon]|nr:hypothetical protein [Candidatus Altiarchaeota archaeon]